MFSCRVHLTEDPNECIDLHVEEEEIRLNKKEVKVMTEEQLYRLFVDSLMNGDTGHSLSGYLIKQAAEKAVELAKGRGLIEVTREEVPGTVECSDALEG